MDSRLTLKSWTMQLLPGSIPLPPNRDMHERHQRKLDRYLHTVAKSVWRLQSEVCWKRYLHEKRQQEKEEDA
eukprot:symbB.v1.2.017948.t1/scaffold1411.1/size120435/6